MLSVLVFLCNPPKPLPDFFLDTGFYPSWLISFITIDGEYWVINVLEIPGC
jgi:hypothetical protein